MMLKKRIIAWILFAAYFISHLTHAGEDIGIGKVAINVLEPVSILSDFVSTGCFVIGGAFIFGSIIKYIEHRRSPLMVPISTVVFLLIAGLLLIFLPVLSLFSEGRIPYSLF